MSITFLIKNKKNLIFFRHNKILGFHHLKRSEKSQIGKRFRKGRLNTTRKYKTVDQPQRGKGSEGAVRV